MITQSYVFKGITLESAIKITLLKITPKLENVCDIELVLNRYTNSTFQYEIEQFEMKFENVENEFVTMANFGNIETLVSEKLAEVPEAAPIE